MPCFWAALSQICSKKLSTGTARTVHYPPDARFAAKKVGTGTARARMVHPPPDAGFGTGGEELFGAPVPDLQLFFSTGTARMCIRLLALAVKCF